MNSINGLPKLVFARDDVERELLVAEAAVEAREPLASPLNELDWARERFVRELMQLEAGQDPAPSVERFIPVALLPALKLGLKVIGRQKVVNYLAKPVAKLIARLVGKEYARPLSQALVDAGLRLVHLEATPEDEMRAAGEAVAATVEETVRKVASLPEEVLEDEELLEAYVLEAFEEAATVNLPDILSEEVYEQRPELREAEHFKSAWVWRAATRTKALQEVHAHLRRVRDAACCPSDHDLRRLHARGVSTGSPGPARRSPGQGAGSSLRGNPGDFTSSRMLARKRDTSARNRRARCLVAASPADTDCRWAAVRRAWSRSRRAAEVLG